MQVPEFFFGILIYETKHGLGFRLQRLHIHATTVAQVMPNVPAAGNDRVPASNDNKAVDRSTAARAVEIEDAPCSAGAIVRSPAP